MEEKSFITGTLIVIVIAAAIAITTVLTPVYLLSYYTCHSKASKQGLECEWGPTQGCMIKLPSGNWMDYDRLRYME